MSRTKKGFDLYTLFFIAPAFILFTLFIIVPTVSSVYYSLTSWDGVSPNIKFVGLANFKEIFTSARFGNALKNTIILTVFITLLENIFALGLALAVDHVRWGKNFFRSAFYVPVLISGIVSGFIWKIMYNYNFGTFNAVLKGLGMQDLRQDWLGNTGIVLFMVGIVLIWKGVGYYMIIYLASLQSVSQDLIEAAQIDGASPWQRFKAITIPMISGAFTINFTLSLINGLKVFDQINVMTDGGPGFTTETLVYLLYKVGFNEGRQGFGTAVGLMLLFIIIVLNTVQQKFLRGREVQM
ncbi:carbohydrate ABC transporter permease [Lacrimispora sp.]|uniref:carbohydrate ABC transporter permease n=1 Tax=Lacrimispora sp. TaxID=2719234 RepID=UPI002FDA7902